MEFTASGLFSNLVQTVELACGLHGVGSPCCRMEFLVFGMESRLEPHSDECGVRIFAVTATCGPNVCSMPLCSFPDRALLHCIRTTEVQRLHSMFFVHGVYFERSLPLDHQVCPSPRTAVQCPSADNDLPPRRHTRKWNEGSLEPGTATLFVMGGGRPSGASER